MFPSKTSLALAALASLALAQNNSIIIPATNGSLPAGGANGCASGYEPGNNTMIYTVPYNFTQVISIIGNYTNLTWAGSPDNSVTTNVTTALANNSWAPGDARTYELMGATLIETILNYSKLSDQGEYVEIHTLAPLTLALPDGNLSTYAPYDGQRWEATCDGRAVTANFTVQFCATNATVAKGVFDAVHKQSVVTVGQFLGGMNFTSCEALAAMNGTTGSSSTNGSGSTNTSGSSGGGSSGASWLTFSWATMVTAGALAILVAVV